MQMALPMKATMNRHLVSEENLMQIASASAKPKTELEASPKMQTPDACPLKAANINDNSAEIISRLVPQITVDKIIFLNFN